MLCREWFCAAEVERALMASWGQSAVLAGCFSLYLRSYLSTWEYLDVASSHVDSQKGAGVAVSSADEEDLWPEPGSTDCILQVRLGATGTVLSCLSRAEGFFCNPSAMFQVNGRVCSRCFTFKMMCQAVDRTRVGIGSSSETGNAMK